MADEEQKPAEETENTAAPDNADDIDALERPDDTEGVTDATDPNKKPEEATKERGGLKAFIKRFNIYLIMFLFVIVLAGVVIALTYFQSKKTTDTTIKSADLSSSVLNQLATSDATVGDAKQVLNVQANAIFAGKVLVRSSVETAGSLQVGGNTTLSALNVTDTSTFGQVQVGKNLAVSGDAGIQGQLSVSKGLQVTGSGSFSGPLSAPQITTSTFQLNGNLVLTSHITAGGPLPSRTSGPALGSGGTSTVSGSDTAGTININTGSNTIPGCFLTITFAQRFTDAPRVIVTPVGADAGTLSYYVTRTATQFSVCDSTAAPTGASFGFDYFIVN
ncbi:MAG: hypothetical protein JWO41_396 [Candidatus Saccharibacteria bacterium]|nr:hypothetical protein [Candidatus Saccharibacteria bacterium]